MTTEKLMGAKPQLASMGIWGSILAGGSSLLLVAEQLLQDPTVLAIIPATALPYVGLFGAALAYFGRRNAKTRIQGANTSGSSY